MPLFRSRRLLAPLITAMASLALVPAAQATDFNLNVDIQGAGKVADVGVPANECDSPLDTPDTVIGHSCAFLKPVPTDAYTTSFDAVPLLSGWRLKAWHGCSRVVNERCEFTVPGLSGRLGIPFPTFWLVAGPHIRAEFEDIAEPETTVTAGPARYSRVKSPTFAFAADDQGTPVTNYTCKLDNGPSQPCQSPKQYFSVPNGQHRFEVAAVDPSGNTDPTPAVHKWTLDTVGPRIAGTYPQTTNRASDTITFDAGDAVKLYCRLDNGPEAPCPLTGYPVTGLADGRHTLELRGIDLAGNEGRGRVEWTLDTRVPGTPTGTAPTPAPVVPAAPAAPMAGSLALRPVVLRRIAWRAVANKRFTRITELTVSDLTAAAKATVSCKGKGCPKRARTVSSRGGAKRLSLTSLLRKAKLRPGAIVNVRVAQRGTRTVTLQLKIQRDKAPKATTA